jgi:tetratricopeptide (TPR) repeat protein
MQLKGEAALYSGDHAVAEASFQRAIELDPNDVGAYGRLARLLAVTGRSDEVMQTYEGALRHNPDSATLHLTVGSLYELRGQIAQAIERYEEAVRIDPKLAVAKNNLAYLIADSGGNLDRALDLAQEAKELLPDNPNAADTLGWVLYKKNVPAAAIGYLREAVGGLPPVDPNLPLVRHHLALAYEANDEPELAIEALEQAVAELERQRTGADGRPRPEAPWAQDVRDQLSRLRNASS